MNPIAASPSSHKRGLFDDLTAWLNEPLPTFTAWMVVHPVVDSTREVKQFMWGKWCRWLDQEGLRLDRVEPGQIAKFFEKEKVAKAHRYRYLRLLETVYIHLGLLGLPIENPARQAALERLGKGENDPTVFLTRDEKAKVEQVIRDWLTGSVASVGDRGEGDLKGSEEKKSKGKKGRKKQDWIRWRDAALCSVMMGSGATVWVCERLSVSCTNSSEGHLSLPRAGAPHYEALLLPIGNFGMEVWLRRRRDLGPTIGDWLFPADQAARKNPTTLSNSAGMHASTVFRAVRGLLREAGITGARACGQTLRNTYGASLVDLGLPDDLVATYMGFHDPTSALRLRANWARAQCVPAAQTMPGENDPF